MNEFLSWLASKRLSGWYFLTLENIFYYKDSFRIEEYSNFLKEINPMVDNPFQLQCDNNTWLLTSKDIFTPKIPIDWCTISAEWDEYLDEIEPKLNNYLLKIVHIPTNESVEIECKDINLTTRSHASTIEFFKNQNYSELQTKTMSFLKEHNIPVTYVHPYGVYFESANMRISIEDNLF